MTTNAYPYWAAKPGEAFEWPEWVNRINIGWCVLQVCAKGHTRYWRPSRLSTRICEVATCYEECRRLLPSELSMYLLGGEQSVIAYMREEIP